LTAIKKHRPLGLIPPGIVVAIELATIIFLGRRSDTVALFMSVACILYFARGWLPPRALVVAVMPLVAAGMFLAPEYRLHSELGANRNAIKNMDLATTFGSVFKGERNEFWTLCYIVQITDENVLYQYGTGFYNAFIASYVPKLVVGEDVKASLFIPVQSADHVSNSYAWNISYGMVPTGPGSAYREFWFFGAVLFYWLARFLRYLWTRATKAGDLLSQAMYALAVTAAMASLTNDMFAIYNPIFMFWLPMLLVTRSSLFSTQLVPKEALA
jgi:hypothetical protein